MSIAANIENCGKSNMHYSIGGVWEGIHKPDGVAYKYYVRKKVLNRKISGEKSLRYEGET
jgi:hypothetical protein